MSAINFNASKSSYTPEHPEIKTQEQKVVDQEAALAHSSSNTDSAALEKVKKQGEMLQALMEKKIADAKETLAPLFRLAEIYELSIYDVLHAILFFNTEMIKREYQSIVDMEQISEEVEKLRKSISTFFWETDPNNLKKTCFACIGTWNTFSKKFDIKKQPLPICDEIINILPLLADRSKVDTFRAEDLKKELSSAEHISLMMGDLSIVIHNGLIGMVQKMQNFDYFVLKEVLPEIDSAFSKSRLTNDPIKELASNLDQFLETTHEIWLLIKSENEPFMALKGKIDITFPHGQILEMIEQFFNNCNTFEAKSQELFEHSEQLSNALKAKTKDTASSLPNAENFLKLLEDRLTSMERGYQILVSLKTLSKKLESYVAAFKLSVLEVLTWKQNQFPKKNLFSIWELFFLYFFSNLEETPNLENRNEIEKKLFGLFNIVNVLFDVFETNNTTKIGFNQTFFKVVCPCVNELNQLLTSAFPLAEITEKQTAFLKSFALFAEFLLISPQSLSIFNARSKYNMEAKEDNQRLLTQHIKLHRKFVESIDFTEVESLLRSLENDEDDTVKTTKNRIQRHIKAQKRLRNLFLAMVPQEISPEILDSKIKEIKEFFKMFCESNEGNIPQIVQSINYIMSRLEGQTKDIQIFLNAGGFQYGNWSFTPALLYYLHENEKGKTKKISKTSRSSFVKPTNKDANKKEEKDSPNKVPLSSPLEVSVLDALLFQSKQIPPPIDLPGAPPLEAEMRMNQFETSLDNINYYVSMLSELLNFSDPLSFPVSFGYLLELYSTLTLELSEKTALAQLPAALNDAPTTHILFRGMPGSIQTQVQWSHDVEELWTLLQKQKPNAFIKTEEQKKHLKTCAFSIISARKPFSQKKEMALAQLYRAHLTGKPEGMRKILNALSQNAFVSLTLSLKALNQVGKPLSLSKFSHSIKEIVSSGTNNQIQDLLDLHGKLKAKGTSKVDAIALKNLPFALMLVNEMLLCTDRLKAPQCYAQILASAPFMVLELCTLLGESLLKLKRFDGSGNPEWESHNLADFLPRLNREDLFINAEKALFKMARSVLKSETRYPNSSYGEISEDLLGLETLCKWRVAVKSGEWQTKEMLYEIKLAYKKNIDHPSLVSDIEKDITEILDRFQQRAELALSASKKILGLLL